ncbi:MAG: hypothetical protein P8R42_28815 [Candidatus Binatia bacterium]|nr:hypothetical protein [Candidatus Binatia bacterium]
MKTLCRVETIAVLAVNLAAWLSTVDAVRKPIEAPGLLATILS